MFLREKEYLRQQRSGAELAERKENVPPGQMVAALVNWDGTLVHEVADENWTDKKGKGVIQFVNLFWLRQRTSKGMKSENQTIV
jgi:hypothetical protein